MSDVPDRVLLYHMTHYTNFAQILHEGAILCINRVHRHFVDIAYPALRNRRRHHPVPIGANGTLADYVPFYFAPRSPMLYAIHQGLVPGYTAGQREIVYLVVPLQPMVDYVCDCFAQAGIQRFATVEVKRDYYYPPRKRSASE